MESPRVDSPRLVPTIDLAKVTDSAAPTTVAAAIDEACRSIGFFAVVNHGVARPAIDRVWETTRALFLLPENAKRACVPNVAGHPYGFHPFAGEALARSRGDAAPPDLKESFSMGPPTTPTDRIDPAELAFVHAGNIWPPALPEMRAAWHAYYAEMAGLAARLMRLFAVALDLAPDHFDDKIDRHISAMRANHYPAATAPPLPGQLRAGAHTDYGSLTILLPQPGTTGLQVRDRAGDWHDVPPVPGGFIINLGDMMERWTNDRWVSTMHRVVAPTAQDGDPAPRLSLAFFHTPNWDAEITCVPTCRGAEGAKYPPVQAGPHLRDKFLRSQQPAETAGSRAS